MRATLKGFDGHVVARGPPVAHPWLRSIYLKLPHELVRSIEKLYSIIPELQSILLSDFAVVI